MSSIVYLLDLVVATLVLLLEISYYFGYLIIGFLTLLTSLYIGGYTCQA